MNGLSSFSRVVPTMFSRHRRVWVLLPVPDSPRNITASPLYTSVEVCTADVRYGAVAMFVMNHMPNRANAASKRSVAPMLLFTRHEAMS